MKLVADLAGLEGQYQVATEKYETVAKSAVANNLMKWSVKEYFLKAGICHLASGVRFCSSTLASAKQSRISLPRNALSSRIRTLILLFHRRGSTSCW